MERVIRIMGFLIVVSMALVGTGHAAYLGADFNGTLKVYDSSSGSWTVADTGGKMVQSITVWGDNAVFGFSPGGSYHGLYTWSGGLSGIGDYNANKVVPWGGGGGLAISTSNGIYTYNNGTSWNLSTGSVPDKLTGWGSNLAGTFTNVGSANGTYFYNGAAWSLINAALPDQMTQWGSTNLALSFTNYGTSNGVYTYDGTNLTRIKEWVPGMMLGLSTRLVTTFTDYGSDNGIWISDGASWASLTDSVPNKLVALGSTKLVGSFTNIGSANGVYYWDGSWHKLTDSLPEDLLTWGAGVAMDFGNLGLYNFDGTSLYKMSDGDANLNPTPTPVPSALLLLASGLVGFVAVRRRIGTGVHSGS